MLQVKLTAIGNSIGIVLPKEALAKLKVGKGDSLYLVESPEGFTLTPYQQDFDDQMQVAEKVLKNTAILNHPYNSRLTLRVAIACNGSSGQGCLG